MIINPMIPIWLMAPICIGLLFCKRKGTFNYMRQIIIILLLFVINLRIMVPDPEAATVRHNVDVLFVVDNTISMLAQDYGSDKGLRMDAVKADCAYIMEQLPGATFSVISFDDNVKTLLPYTIDTLNVTQSLQSLNGMPSLYARGTGFEKVLNYLKDALDRESDNLQIVFFISDGEITMDETLGSYPELKDFIDGGAVLGYGTDEGGRMLVYAYSGDNAPEELYYYDDDFNRQTALSCIDEDNLKSIASDMGIDYIHMTEQSKINSIINEIKQQIETAGNDEEDSTAGYSDTFFYLLFPLIPLLAADFIYYKRKVNF